MKKFLMFFAFAFVAIAGFIITNDSSVVLSYANKIGSMLGTTAGYTERTVNAVQDSVNSTTSAVEDLKEGKARMLIEEQRKKIEEMKKELEQAMKDSQDETKSKE